MVREKKKPSKKAGTVAKYRKKDDRSYSEKKAALKAEYDVKIDSIVAFFGNMGVIWDIIGKQPLYRVEFDAQYPNRGSHLLSPAEKNEKFVISKRGAVGEATHFYCITLTNGSTEMKIQDSYDLNHQMRNTHGLCWGFAMMYFEGVHKELKPKEYSANGEVVLRYLLNRSHKWLSQKWSNGQLATKVLKHIMFVLNAKEPLKEGILDAFAGGHYIALKAIIV